MNTFDYDLLVLGSGPGGYVAAIRASQLGLKVGIVEKEKLGGVCLNIGCIPSKSLIHHAEVFRSIKDLEALGVKVDTKGFDYKKVFDKSRAAADTLSKGVGFLMKKNKIDVITGWGRIAGLNRVAVDKDKTYTAKNILIATGSRPRAIPWFEIDEKNVLTSTGMLMAETLPKSIIILGAGAIGIEFAHIMNAFGAEVHVVEMLDQILPLDDEEVAGVLKRSFEKRGIKIMLGTKATGMTKKGKDLEISLEEKGGLKSTLSAEKVLVAVGRAPNTEDLGLAQIGIITDKGFIPVGDYYETKVRGIFAIGDVVASPLLAHVASKEGEMAAEYMAGHKPKETKVDPDLIPDAVYAEPQVAGFGYTEQRARKEGIKYKKATFPYRGAGKSVAVEKTEGMVKVIFDPDTKEILGGHVVGAEATELIHELLLAKKAELLPEDVATMIHAHPTLSEAITEVMKAVDGWAIHV